MPIRLPHALRMTIAATAVTIMIATVASAQFNVGPSVEYGAISRPSGITNGDFNGDGARDLATTADNVDRVVVFQNAGNGTFGTTMDFFLPASSSPQDVIAGDFDGDMDLDFAVALRDPGGTVQIMTNNGTGLFSLGSSVSVGDRPRGLSMADFDGDMDLDLAVANRDSDTMSILTNNGSGLFTAASVAVGMSRGIRRLATSCRTRVWKLRLRTTIPEPSRFWTKWGACFHRRRRYRWGPSFARTGSSPLISMETVWTIWPSRQATLVSPPCS